MAEIGIVASIIGVAGAGFRLSLVLNAISCEVANAPLEIHHISKAVTLFSLMLKQIGTVLQAADSIHTHEAVEAAKQVAEESNRVFDEINFMLDKVRSKKEDGSVRPSVQQRIKWCFKKSRITYLLAQLDSLKLNLSLMLQILQLGRMMAFTSRSDPPEVVTEKKAVIQQERAEAQNILIIHYMQSNETEALFRHCEEDHSAPSSPIEYKKETDSGSQVTISSPPSYTSSNHLLRLPPVSLGEVDQMLKHMCDSSKDMVRVSDQAIDPLLERWTRWKEVREQRHNNSPNGKYMPTVYSLNEDDTPYHARFRERDDSPRGYHLEGTTVDWRQPNSVIARQDYMRRKKQYAGYQPSVSAQSSDREDSPGSNASSKRNSKRHVINSSSESSDSEAEIQSKKASTAFQPGPPLDRSTSKQPSLTQSTPPGQQMPSRMPPTPAQSTSSRTPTTPQQNPSAFPRPHPTPDQNMQHHSISMPLPPVSIHNAPNPYAQYSPQHPSGNCLPPYGQYTTTPPSRPYQQQNRMPVPRPISRDGKRSPSRLSQEMPRDAYRDWDQDRDRDRDRCRDRDKGRGVERDRDREREREHPRHEKRHKESKTKALREGATKGLLGAGALSIFLEALGELDI